MVIMKTTNAKLNRAIEDQIAWRAQMQYWVRKENLATYMSEEYITAFDMRTALKFAKVRFGGHDGAEIAMASLVSTTLNMICELDEDEYDSIIEQIGSEEALKKYIYAEALKLADKMEVC
jgi:hypothetical protein